MKPEGIAFGTFHVVGENVGHSYPNLLYSFSFSLAAA